MIFCLPVSEVYLACYRLGDEGGLVGLEVGELVLDFRNERINLANLLVKIRGDNALLRYWRKAHEMIP